MAWPASTSAWVPECAKVIRESGGDRIAVVTGRTKVLSDNHDDQDHFQSWRNVPGPHDRVGGRRRAAENAERIALDLLIAGLTLVFLMAVATLPPLPNISVPAVGSGLARRPSKCWFRCWSA